MKKSIFVIAILMVIGTLTSCFNEKNSPFYDSQWIMPNYDKDGNLYYHHLILSPGHNVLLRTSYDESTNIIVWKGTYKINSKKIVFNFDTCSRFEKEEFAGHYSDKRLIKFYSGEFLYSAAEIKQNDENVWHLQLIRPKNQIYGETKDIFGNYFDEFIKIE